MLHDIDKTGDNRLNSTPNNDDKVIDRLAHGTTQNQNSGEEAQADGLKFLERQIIAKQDGVNKAVFGFFGEANKFGLKVAEDGVDVLTASDDGLIFNSEQNVFKIVVSSTAAQSVPSLAQDVTDTLTVPHNLGYIPAVIVFLNGTGSTYLTANRYYPLPQSVSVKVGATYYPGIIYNFNVDSTNIYFTVTNSSAATPITDIGTANWKYYLLQETAN